jgi:site-specific recombinase XerD
MDSLLPVTRTPLSVLLDLVANSVHSPHSKRAYRAAIGEFLAWHQSSGAPGFTKATVQQYRCTLELRHLSASSIKLKMSTIRRLASEMADNALLDPEIARGIARVSSPSRRGVRLGNWLTLAQAEELLALPDTETVKGKRDRALLSVLIGAGLRRSEAAALTFEHVQQREGRWVIADLIGKGEHVRTVPIPGWCKAAIDLWSAAAGINTGQVFRPLNKSGAMTGPALAPETVLQIVKAYGRQIGIQLAPHDVRRTFARLAHNGRAALEQIQLSLGHESIITTEAYLGVRQDLNDAPCDRLGIRPTGVGEECGDYIKFGDRGDDKG